MTVVGVETIAMLDLVLGSLAGLGLLYLLYSETLVVQYARFFQIITVGLLGYAVTGPVVGSLDPGLIHAVHGTATLFIVVGLYGLVSDDVGQDDEFERVLGVRDGFDGDDD